MHKVIPVMMWQLIVGLPVAGALNGPAMATDSVTNRLLTLEACLRIGLEEASVIRNARRDRAIADSSISQVRAQVFPQVSTDARYTRVDAVPTAEFGDQRFKLGNEDQYAIGLAVRQLVYSGGAVNAALDAARDLRIMADYELERMRAETAYRIREQFADLLAFAEAVEVNRQAIVQWQLALHQTEARFSRDLASELDVLAARVQVANAVPVFQQASNRLAIARLAFADLLNLADDRFALQGELAYHPFEGELDELLKTAAQNRPELRLARQALSLRAAELTVERSAYRPSLSVSARYDGQQAPLNSGGDSGPEWQWSATVQAQWSWLDGGLRRQRVRQRKLERDKAGEDADALHRRVALEVRQAWLAIRQSGDLVTATRESLALAERSMEIAGVRYRTGLITRLELTDVQMALMRARLQHLEALRQHVHAVNTMNFAIGVGPDAGNDGK